MDDRKRELLERASDKPLSFYTFHVESVLRKSYTFLHRSLVYANVDHIKHEHRQMVTNETISEVQEDFERAETAAVRHQLVETLSKQWK